MFPQIYCQFDGFGFPVPDFYCSIPTRRDEVITISVGEIHRIYWSYVAHESGALIKILEKNIYMYYT